MNLSPVQRAAAVDIDQCPAKWNLKLAATIPGSNAGSTPFPKEIRALQQELGNKFAARQISAEVEIEIGKWTAIPEENVGRVGIALSGKRFRVQYSIATIQCPDPIFVYSEGVFPLRQNVSMTPKEFISKYLANSSLDFQQLIEIENNIFLCAENIKKAAATSIDGKVSATFGWVTPKCDTPDTYLELQPIFHQLNCFHWSRDYNFYLRAGEICDLSLLSNGISLLTFQLKGPVLKKEIDKKADPKLPILTSEEIELAKKTIKSTILCLKGSVTKKVTAINPKCPAGYKKK